MKKAAALLLFTGCAGVHSTLEAARDTELVMATPFTVECIVRNDEGNLDGDTREIQYGQKGEIRALRSDADDVTIWGKKTIRTSSVTYTFGQICTEPRACEDYLFLESEQSRVWLRIETIRPAKTPEVFESQLQEAFLIDDSTKGLRTPKQRQLFQNVARELASAEATRSGALSYVASTITDISANMTEASALLSFQMELAEVYRVMEEHNIMLQGGASADLRPFEIVRAICMAPRD